MRWIGSFYCLCLVSRWRLGSAIVDKNATVLCRHRIGPNAQSWIDNAVTCSKIERPHVSGACDQHPVCRSVPSELRTGLDLRSHQSPGERLGLVGAHITNSEPFAGRIDDDHLAAIDITDPRRPRNELIGRADVDDHAAECSSRRSASTGGGVHP